ncbi:hypothetical protein [Streptomyces sp. NPDC045251]|uniref:hypothetical protein n=1 Tax=unclassified Streptomyces TaxID=2593676 RepID=UPI0033CB5475
MATKTTPKTFAATIAAEEAEVTEKLPALEEAATEAHALIEERKEQAAEAEGRLNAYRRKLGTGSVDFTPADYAEAFHGVEYARLLAEGQERTAKRLRESLPNGDKRLAALVAEAVERVTPYAAEVIPTFLRPVEAPENLTTGPVVVITQDGKATEKGGILTAGLTIRSFRLPHFQQIDKRDVVREFDARGWNLRFEPTTQTERRDGFVVDVIRVQQLSAYASVPVITKDPTERDVNAVIGTLSIEMVRAFPVQREMAGGLTVSPGGGVSAPDMSARPESKRFRVKTDGNTRTVTVEAEYKVQSNTPNFPIEAVHAAAGKGAQAMVDKFFQGVGVVEKVSHFDMQTDNPQNVGVRVVLTSKTA